MERFYPIMVYHHQLWRNKKRSPGKALVSIFFDKVICGKKQRLKIAKQGMIGAKKEVFSMVQAYQFLVSMCLF